MSIYSDHTKPSQVLLPNVLEKYPTFEDFAKSFEQIWTKILEDKSLTRQYASEQRNTANYLEFQVVIMPKEPEEFYKKEVIYNAIKEIQEKKLYTALSDDLMVAPTQELVKRSYNYRKRVFAEPPLEDVEP